jgi:bifunctional enzyme CysN/CysC
MTRRPAEGERILSGEEDAGDLLRVVIFGSGDEGEPALLRRVILATGGMAAKSGEGIASGYRRISTPHRHYLVAEPPGHGQFTPELVSAASTADLAIIVVDARKGMQTRTRRHFLLAVMMGVRQVVLAVDRMDEVAFAEDEFRAIEAEANGIAQRVKRGRVIAIPVSAVGEDNLATPGARMPWYQGPTLRAALDNEPDVSGGDRRTSAEGAPEVADQFEASLIWMSDAPMLGGRGYLMKIGAETVTAVPSAPKYSIDPNTLDHLAAKTLRANEIGVCNLSLDRPVSFDPSGKSRETGGFVLIDRLTNETVGAGLLHFALRRSHNLHMQTFDIDRIARGGQKGQRPAVIWLTGLSGAGKSTIANLLERALYAQGRHTYVLDGDNVRHGLNRDLGFTPADRVENVRRVAEVARLMADAGLIVVVSLISPYRQERRMARALVTAGKIDFLEVFVDTPLAVAEQRDPKGLYAKARRGELANLTGIDAPYEAPEAPELRLDASVATPESSTEALLACLRLKNLCI